MLTLLVWAEHENVALQCAGNVRPRTVIPQRRVLQGVAIDAEPKGAAAEHYADAIAANVVEDESALKIATRVDRNYTGRKLYRSRNPGVHPGPGAPVGGAHCLGPRTICQYQEPDRGCKSSTTQRHLPQEKSASLANALASCEATI